MSDPVDVDALRRWMDGEGLGSGPIRDIRLLKGGTQNVLVRFERGGEAYVLRRGPEHLRASSNDAMRREMRVLGALGSTDVPHPRLLGACPDEHVMHGAAFYLMEEIVGVNASVELSDVQVASSDVRHAMGLAAVDAAAQLAAVDHVAIGLGDLGRPDGFLERQVERWTAHLDSFRKYDGYPAEVLRDEVGTLAAWLDANRPHDFTPGVMHGDFHLANMLFAPDGPQVAAILDWEMCTIGDPLLDLGWLLATWPGEGWDGVGGALARAGGLPGPGELVERYASRSQRDLSAIAWYEVLACLKFATIIEETYARACAGLAKPKMGELLHRWALIALARGRRRTDP